jgi:hypothetical protein
MKTALKIGVLTILLYVGVRAILPDKDGRAISAGVHAAFADPSNPVPKDIALRDAKLDFHWAKRGFGTVMMADFKLQNPTPYRLKDFEVTCTSFGASGTEIDRNKKVIYEVIEPKSTKSLKHVNMGFVNTQAASTSCELTDLVIVPSVAQ